MPPKKTRTKNRQIVVEGIEGRRETEPSLTPATSLPATKSKEVDKPQAKALDENANASAKKDGYIGREALDIWEHDKDTSDGCVHAANSSGRSHPSVNDFADEGITGGDSEHHHDGHGWSEDQTQGQDLWPRISCASPPPTIGCAATAASNTAQPSTYVQSSSGQNSPGFQTTTSGILTSVTAIVPHAAKINMESHVSTQPKYNWNHPKSSQLAGEIAQSHRTNPARSSFVRGNWGQPKDVNTLWGERKPKAPPSRPPGKQAWEFWGREGQHSARVHTTRSPSGWGGYVSGKDSYSEDESEDAQHGWQNATQSGWYTPQKQSKSSESRSTQKHNLERKSLRRQSSRKARYQPGPDTEEIVSHQGTAKDWHSNRLGWGDAWRDHGWNSDSQQQNEWGQTVSDLDNGWGHSNNNHDNGWGHPTNGHGVDYGDNGQGGDIESSNKGWDSAFGGWGAGTGDNQSYNVDVDSWWRSQADEHTSSGAPAHSTWSGNGNDTAFSIPSRTMTHAFNGTTLDPSQAKKVAQYIDTKFVESRGAALEKVQTAIFGKERKARERIHWMFSPNKDERVSKLISWIGATEHKLGSYGLRKFLQSRERGALFANATFHMENHPDEPCFDWLTFDQLQETRDSILQNSVIHYDPAMMVYVFVFLPSPTGKSVAMWRRKVPVPNNARLRFRKEISSAKSGLRNTEDYVVHIDELPAEKSTLQEASHRPRQSYRLPPGKKKRKWWQVLRFAE